VGVWGGKGGIGRHVCAAGVFLVTKNLLSNPLFSYTHLRREALREEVVRWTAIVKEAANRHLAKVVDGSKEGGEEEG